jgi:integrase
MQRGSLRQEQRKDGLTWVFRFRTTRPIDGKRVEHKMPVGLVRDLPSRAAAWAEVERQRLIQSINYKQGFSGKSVTFAEIAQHYAEHELPENSLDATIPKAYATAGTYRRHIQQRLIPRWGKRKALSIEPLEVEAWLKDLRRVEGLENPTLDKLRRVMSLIYSNAQRNGILARDEASNPMNFVRQNTISGYTPVSFGPEQTLCMLMALEEPYRTLTLTAAATALRASELMAIRWGDLDFEHGVLHVREAYVWGKFGPPKSKASRGPVPLHPFLASFLQVWRGETPYSAEGDLVFASARLRGKKPMSANTIAQKHLRRAAIAAGVLKKEQKDRFGFHNFRHALANTLVQIKCDPKTVQRLLRQADVRTTLQLYVQGSDRCTREAQGDFLELLLGGKGDLLRRDPGTTQAASSRLQ